MLIIFFCLCIETGSFDIALEVSWDYVKQTSLEITEIPPASDSGVLRLEACATMSGSV